MNEIIFSIVLVSRGRPELLGDLIKSVRETSYFRNEVVVCCDLDDDETLGWIKSGDYDLPSNQQDLTFLFTSRMSNLHEYINKATKLMRGQYIFILNDDCLLTENRWDYYAEHALKKGGDIVYGRTHDDSIDRVSADYAAFPIFSRKAVEVLGFAMDETFGNHGSDVVTYRIYEGANAVVDLPMVKIKHIYHNSEDALVARQRDKTAVDMVKRTFGTGFNVQSLFSLDVSKKTERLKNA